MITDLKTIYKIANVGDVIGYYSNGERIENTFKEGIITKIEPCPDGYRCRADYICDRFIEIDGNKKNKCHVYGPGKFSIKYIKKNEFISKEDFEL